MTLTGFIILIVLVLMGLFVFVKLASLPGAKARDRGHVQADAINVLGWLGLLFGGLPWLVAVVWAYSSTTDGTQRTTDAAGETNGANGG